VNTVPDCCTIEVDRRVLPVENAQAALDHCLDYLQLKLPNAPVVHERPYMLTRGLADTANQELAVRLSSVIRQHGGPGERIGVPFGTDAPHFAATGCPTVVFGPGSIDQAHTADEWIDLDQLRAAAEILYGFARDAD
jgi:acetylornithine deacetylase